MSNIFISKFHKAYPDDEHGHMFPCKIVKPCDYDKPYEYRVTSKIRKLGRFFVEAILFLFGPIIAYFAMAPKYTNKKMIKKYKNEIKNGFMTISNHVFPLDNIVLRNIYKFHRVEFPIWKEGAESSLGGMLRLGGGITVPTGSRGIVNCFHAMDQVIKEKGWLHVYPEAACWEFYSPIREFKSGTLRIAYEHDVPVFPVAFSFRPARGLFGLWKKGKPCVNVAVGEPLYADKKLDKREGVFDLCRRIHEAVVRLAGFSSEEENDDYKERYSYYPYVNPYLEQYEKLQDKK